MQRIYLFLSIVLLITFVGDIAFEFYTNTSTSQISVLTEEVDLEDMQDDESEEVVIQLDICQLLNSNDCVDSTLATNTNHYSFAIKSHFPKTVSPPPEV